MRSSPRHAVFAAALTVATLTAPAYAADATQTVSVRRHVIEIQKLKFAPSSLEVSPGDTIVWVNKDFVPHTATAKDKSWSSKSLKKGAEWQMIVQTGMRTDYFCKFHPAMKAHLQIVE